MSAHGTERACVRRKHDHKGKCETSAERENRSLRLILGMMAGWLENPPPNAEQTEEGRKHLGSWAAYIRGQLAGLRRRRIRDALRSRSP